MRRRMLLAGMSLLALPGSMSSAWATSLYGDEEDGRDPSLLPPPESPIDFEIPATDFSKIPEKYLRQMVDWDGVEEPGTVIVDAQKRYLYLVLESGTSALRYGVGVGRQGFSWSGEAVVGMKRRWPRWVPPEEMVARDEKAAKWANGMPGGPENPLGARALYLHSNGEDTMFRIHGTTEPSSIGKAMSSGCIRMLNEDIADLFLRVPIGTPVVVRQANS